MTLAHATSNMSYRLEDGLEKILLEEVEKKGNFWNRVDYPLAVEDGQKFRVVISGQFNKSNEKYFADLAIDDVSFTPKCR